MLRHACGFKLANDGVDTRTWLGDGDAPALGAGCDLGEITGVAHAVN